MLSQAWIIFNRASPEISGLGHPMQQRLGRITNQVTLGHHQGLQMQGRRRKGSCPMPHLPKRDREFNINTSH